MNYKNVRKQAEISNNKTIQAASSKRGRNGTAIIDNRKTSIIQQKQNKTGLPDNLKSGIENLSGMAMDHVKVHYNSAMPAQMQAHAYAQGSDIHVAPGQEKHLPHEAWHVVQQAKGRVKPTMQLAGGVPVNDNKGLEKEADHMGAKALQTVQRYGPDENEELFKAYQRKSSRKDNLAQKKQVSVQKKSINPGIYGANQPWIPRPPLQMKAVNQFQQVGMMSLQPVLQFNGDSWKDHLPKGMEYLKGIPRRLFHNLGWMVGSGIGSYIGGALTGSGWSGFGGALGGFLGAGVGAALQPELNSPEEVQKIRDDRRPLLEPLFEKVNSKQDSQEDDLEKMEKGEIVKENNETTSLLINK